MPDEVKMIDLPILLTTIKEHLPYEICMLRKTFVELNDRAKIGPQAQRPDELIPNALKESFCIHARSLIDFFVRRSRSTDAIASDFAPDLGIFGGKLRNPQAACRYSDIALGAMEAAEWGKCRWDPAAKPGAQFLDLDYQCLIFSLEFVARMAIADYRRGCS